MGVSNTKLTSNCFEANISHLIHISEDDILGRRKISNIFYVERYRKNTWLHRQWLFQHSQVPCGQNCSPSKCILLKNYLIVTTPQIFITIFLTIFLKVFLRIFFKIFLKIFSRFFSRFFLWRTFLRIFLNNFLKKISQDFLKIFLRIFLKIFLRTFLRIFLKNFSRFFSGFFSRFFSGFFSRFFTRFFSTMIVTSPQIFPKILVKNDLIVTSPQKAPAQRGLSRSWTTTTCEETRLGLICKGCLQLLKAHNSGVIITSSGQETWKKSTFGPGIDAR